MRQQTIGVIGGGLMGHGIAYLLAAAGHKVGIFEPDAASRASLPRPVNVIVKLLGDDAALLRPHPFLRDKVLAGKLGMKTGEGLRQWTPQSADAVRERLSRFLAEQARAPKQR